MRDAEQSTRTVSARGALTINEFCDWARVGRTLTYAEIAAGRLEAVKIGAKTLIPMDSAEAWRAALPRIKASGMAGGANG